MPNLWNALAGRELTVLPYTNTQRWAMILYHTSDREIRNPDVHYGRKNADFGWGFYLTPDREFTYRWARDHAVVNMYEFDESGLDVHTFSRGVEWFQYIFYNRRAKDTLTADVVEGPIANDTIFDTLGVISSGYLEPEDALKLLMIGPSYTQIALKTERAAQRLRWIGAERIRRLEEASLRKEQELFEEAFGAELEKILDAKA